MNAGAKLAAYALVLAAAFGGGAALGNVVGPIDVGGSPSHDEPEAPSPADVPQTDHGGTDADGSHN